MTDIEQPLPRRNHLSRDVVMLPETLSRWAAHIHAKWLTSAYSPDDMLLLEEAVVSWRAVREAVFERDDGCCAYCRKSFPRLTRSVHIDHVIPRAQNGNDLPENLTVSCASCNVRKGGRTPEQWAAYVKPPKREPAPRPKTRRPPAVGCPVCDAKPHHRCFGVRGARRKAFHKERLKLAREK